MSPLILDKPATLVLEPREVALVLDALAERPYKVVAPLFDKIKDQIMSAQEAPPPAP